jgi:CheY-like chemotaxis protein
MPRVLIADDSAVIRRVLRAQLESLSADILEAADGRAALELARAEQPGIAVLDLNMPELNGFEVCARLKADADTRDMQVFILTAHGESDVKGYAFGAGADGFFTKPEGTRALVERIAELLRRP